MVKIIINLLIIILYKLVKDMDLIHLFHFYIIVIKVKKINNNSKSYIHNKLVNK